MPTTDQMPDLGSPLLGDPEKPDGCKGISLVLPWQSRYPARGPNLCAAMTVIFESSDIQLPPEGGIARISTDAGSWLLIRTNGQLHAVEDLCAHQPRPLAAGDIEGGCLRCPHHGVSWDLATGRAVDERGYVDLGEIRVGRCRMDGSKLVIET